MTKVRRLDRAKKRFEQRAAAAAQDYVDGAVADDSWENNAANAEQNYEAGVRKAADTGQFGKGVRKAGQAKYRAGVQKTGRGRYSAGVSGAGEQWEQGFQPYRDALEATTLPPRGPKGSAANRQRMLDNLDAIEAEAERQRS